MRRTPVLWRRRTILILVPLIVDKDGELDYDLSIPEYRKKAGIYGIIPFSLTSYNDQPMRGGTPPNTVSLSLSTVSQESLELTCEVVVT